MNIDAAPMNCSLSIPEVPGMTSGQLTVGRHFNYLCEGNIGSFDFTKAQLSVEPDHQYEFHLVKAIPNQSQSGVTLDMVSYVTGEIKTTDLKISDSQNEMLLKIQPIKLDSVMPPPQKNAEGVEQPTEPFSYNILNLKWPVTYTIVFALIFCAILAGLIVQSMRVRKFVRLRRELKDYDSALSADLQFYKHIRLLEKKNYPIADVSRQFEIYVIRRYQVPLFGLSSSEADRYLKKNWPTLMTERRELKNILLDLKKMSLLENPSETKIYLKKLYQFVDHSEEKLGGLS